MYSKTYFIFVRMMKSKSIKKNTHKHLPAKTLNGINCIIMEVNMKPNMKHAIKIIGIYACVICNV